MKFDLIYGVGEPHTVDLNDAVLLNMLLAGLELEIPYPFSGLTAQVKAGPFEYDLKATLHITSDETFYVHKDGMSSKEYKIKEFIEENYKKVLDFIGDNYKAEAWMFSSIWQSRVGCEKCYDAGHYADCWGKEACHGYYNGCGCKYCVEQDKEGGQDELCDCSG
ncbi:MAG: hypothetical protein QXS54_06710 [Candidatus Methanomethylicaceae archaeon]